MTFISSIIELVGLNSFYNSITRDQLRLIAKKLDVKQGRTKLETRNNILASNKLKNITIKVNINIVPISELMKPLKTICDASNELKVDINEAVNDNFWDLI